ncbi:hypothetical protein B0H14DRAFT_810272 [Mycena olivaceomarginata]|nr:hypothetical protein B0H14DRAFT_810272 [Mycena olivaceomarginata]
MKLGRKTVFQQAMQRARDGRDHIRMRLRTLQMPQRTRGGERSQNVGAAAKNGQEGSGKRAGAQSRRYAVGGVTHKAPGNGKRGVGFPQPTPIARVGIPQMRYSKRDMHSMMRAGAHRICLSRQTEPHWTGKAARDSGSPARSIPKKALWCANAAGDCMERQLTLYRTSFPA